MHDPVEIVTFIHRHKRRFPMERLTVSKKEHARLLQWLECQMHKGRDEFGNPIIFGVVVEAKAK